LARNRTDKKSKKNNMSEDKKIKIGLALGSGGVRGLAHIGVIKVLKANSIPINYIAGSSIGAMVGAYYAATQDVDKLESVALSNTWRTSLSLLDPTWRGGLVKGNKVEQMITGWFKDISFDTLKIPLTVVATDLITGQEVNIREGDLIKAIRGSVSVPVIFKPVKYKQYLLADGGLSNPLPDDVVRSMGADIVIAVNLEKVHLANGFQEGDLSLLKVSLRSINVMRHHLAQYSKKTADIIIEPKVSEDGIISWNRFFDNKKVGKIIKLGEEATIKALPEIKKLLI
jgi:NTE family protein